MDDYGHDGMMIVIYHYLWLLDDYDIYRKRVPGYDYHGIDEIIFWTQVSGALIEVKKSVTMTEKDKKKSIKDWIIIYQHISKYIKKWICLDIFFSFVICLG